MIPPTVDLSTLAPMDVAGRLPRLRERLGEAGCDALLVTNLANVRYLTGFTGSAALLLVLPDELVLATDGRYQFQSAEQLAAAGVDARIEIGNAAGQRQALSASARSVARLGLEAASVTWARQRAFAAEWFADAELVATENVVEDLRRVKDDGEVARMAAAAAVSDQALAAVRHLLAEGTSEAGFALALDSEIRRLGASGNSFDTIVASGPNGAKPHARPTDRVVEAGELVVVDFGAVVDGYCSDMTRTLCVGPPRSAVLERMVEVVAASQAAGVAAVRAGRRAVDVDATCREVIAAAGWADAFLHSTGHGVGLDIHEAPSVSAVSGDTLATGYVVTVEPGVYLPDHGGVRIEDTVVVTEDGCRPLTLAPKDLIIQ
ncbi:MAG TPA: Xaa-Pro peptidase family protein [Acidimicrobiales bacterium]|nr:Xaa-Pro peptidase family protein [Acidimicrobiales bacterium]